MEENQDTFKKFKDTMQNLHGKLHVLDVSIPMEEQMLYFKTSQKVKADLDVNITLHKIPLLFETEYELEFKRRLLPALAALDSVEALRALERYSKEPDEELKNWSLLALEESKMNIERSISNEEQVFLSTGLGGRGNMLRFYVIFFPVTDDGFTDFHIKTMKSELEFGFKRNKAELEACFDNDKRYFAYTALFDVTVDIRNVLDTIIEECNQYGAFLRTNVLVTNVKIYTQADILNYIRQINKT